jgi:hypothetical protein
MQNSVTGKHEVHGEFLCLVASLYLMRTHLRVRRTHTESLIAIPICSLQAWSRGELAAAEMATLAFTQEFLNTWTGSRRKCPTPAPVIDVKILDNKECTARHLIY